MAKGINIPMALDARSFAVDVKRDVAGPLEDAADVLDDLAKAGDKTSDELERSFRDAQNAAKDFGDRTSGAQKDAGKATDDLDGKIRSFADTAKRESKDAGDSIGSNIKHGAEEAGEGVETFKDEAKGNAAEVASSFDGSAQSLVDGFQGAAAVAFAGFGPAGMAAGIAAAAGIGLISAALGQSDEKSQAFKDDVSALTSELITAGKKGGPSLDYIVQKLQDLATATDDGAVNLDKIFDVSGRAGSSAKDLAQAYAGQTGEIQKLLDAGRAKYDQDIDSANAVAGLTTEQQKAKTGDENAYANLQKKAAAQDDYNKYLVEARDKTVDAKKEQDEYAAAGGPAMEAKAKLIGSVNDAYDDGAAAIDDYLDKEGEFEDVDGYIKSMTARQKALADYQQNLAKSPLTDSAKDFLESQGADAAAQFLAGYQRSTPDQQAALNKSWTEAGKTNSGQYTDALQAGIDTTTLKAPNVTLDSAALGRQIDDALNKPRVIKVNADLYTRDGKKII